MTDIVPELLKALEDRLQRAFKNDRELQDIKTRIKQGTAQSIDSERFSIRAGEILSRVWKSVITQGELPDDRMYYNIARRLLDPTLHTGFDEVSGVCTDIVQLQYTAAGQPLSQIVAVHADFSQDRLDGLVDYISSKERYSEAEPEFLEKLINFHQDIHSQTVEKNFKNLGQMGFTPKIVRKSLGSCCEWCQRLEGSYDYHPGMDREVFRKHSHCRCTVEYYPDGPRGGHQDVWSKQWKKGVSKSGLQAIKANDHEPLEDFIKANPTAKHLNRNKQGKHIPDHPNYVEGKSRLSISMDECDEILYNEAGKGSLVFDRNGNWTKKERVITDKDIGIVISEDGSSEKTCGLMIHYSKTGAHIIPRKVSNDELSKSVGTVQNKKE
ncbi:polymorphic toxin type 50 domain-containing protein [Faecalibaculum rodentium]|uniref:polymorphic toxin type 50 domain-containing protein n=4 Tax=Faecalibaculum rodentium TaxID=1702221 RepID=UPI0025B73F68|nr:polymorphic toxin type 50 domain-containing protein [Faecalibaculum rodentium]